MNPHPTVLKPTDIIHTAVEYIMKYRYRNLPVIDEAGRYLGIFGVNCLLRLVLPKAAVIDPGIDSVPFIQDNLSDLHDRLREVENQPVSICMNTDIATVTPETPLVETLLILHRTRTSIPVVEQDGKLAGMISYWDAGERILSA
jgi:CBS-domain-containing membrane protein